MNAADIAKQMASRVDAVFEDAIERSAEQARALDVETKADIERTVEERLHKAREAVRSDIKALAPAAEKLAQQQRTEVFERLSDLESLARSISQPAEIRGAGWLSDPKWAEPTQKIEVGGWRYLEI